jgi:hypothetical protein
MIKNYQQVRYKRVKEKAECKIVKLQNERKEKINQRTDNHQFVKKSIEKE